jgi:hypothetical protein
LKEQDKTLARLEEYEKFFRWNPEANKMHMDYLQERRQEAQRKAAEQKRQAEEQARRLEEERALAPILERMKKRGFDTQEIAEKLHEKGIGVKPPTLAKYWTNPPPLAAGYSPSLQTFPWTNCSAEHHAPPIRKRLSQSGAAFVLVLDQ